MRTDDGAQSALFIFAITAILVYLLAVSCDPALSAIVATPTPAVSILELPGISP